MTLTEVRDLPKLKINMKPVDIGELLRESLWQALTSNRVTCGVFECAKLLACNPDNVMLCVLPEAGGAHDVTIHIQHTLIEAFCWENEIKLLKVDSAEKLTKVVNEADGLHKMDDGAVARFASSDVSCLLVEFPKVDLSPEDEKVADYFHTVMSNDVYPKPVIELPV